MIARTWAWASPEADAVGQLASYFAEFECDATIITCPADAGVPAPNAFRDALMMRDLRPAFVGWTPDQRHLIAIDASVGEWPGGHAPVDYRVVAFVPTYNEADIISHTLDYLASQDLDVYVIDNWSTDETYERVQSYIGPRLIGLERFPAYGPLDTYEWRLILSRIEVLATEITANWFVLHDADERREAPWAGVGLRDAFHHVEQCGFNCVDHVVVTFSPVDIGPLDPGRDVDTQLRHFSFSDHLGHFHQRKAWKKTEAPVSLASSAGHDVSFPERLVYPFKFLIKHYPVRSEEHGRRKVINDRAQRWSGVERACGWHRQYDEDLLRGTFVRDRSSLQLFDAPVFATRHVIERLSGIGVFREVPWWATGPRQVFERVF